MNLPESDDSSDDKRERIPCLFDRLPVEMFNKIILLLDKRGINNLRMAYKDFSKLVTGYPIDVHSASMILQSNSQSRKCENGSQIEYKLTDNSRESRMSIPFFGGKYKDANFNEFTVIMTLTTRRIEQVLQNKVLFTANTIRIKHCYDDEDKPEANEDDMVVPAAADGIRHAHLLRQGIRVRPLASGSNLNPQFAAPWREHRPMQPAQQQQNQRGLPEQWPQRIEVIPAEERVGIIDEENPPVVEPVAELQPEPELPAAPRPRGPPIELQLEDEGVIMLDNPRRLPDEEAELVEELLNEHQIINDDDDLFHEDHIQFLRDDHVEIIPEWQFPLGPDQLGQMNNNLDGNPAQQPNPEMPILNRNEAEWAMMFQMEEDRVGRVHAQQIRRRRRWQDDDGNHHVEERRPVAEADRLFFQLRGQDPDGHRNQGVMRRAMARRRRMREVEERRRFMIWRDLAAGDGAAELNLFPHEDVRRLERRLQQMVYQRPPETVVEPKPLDWKISKFSEYIMLYKPLKLALEYVEPALFTHFWDNCFDKINEIHMLDWNRPCTDLLKCTHMNKVVINHFVCPNPEEFLHQIIMDFIFQDHRTFGFWSLGINHILAMGRVLDGIPNIVSNGAGEYRIRLDLFVLILTVQARTVSLQGQTTHELCDGRILSREGVIIDPQLNDELYTDDDFLYSDSDAISGWSDSQEYEDEEEDEDETAEAYAVA